MHRGLFLGGGANLSLGKTLVLGGIQQQGFITYQDQDQPWHPRAWPRGNRSTLVILTSVKFYGANGQAPTKQWRYDYNTAESGWSWAAPHSNLLAPLLTSVKFFGAGGQAPTKQWRYDHDADSAWQVTYPRNMGLLVVPFVPVRWNFRYQEDANWAASPAKSALLSPLLTAGGQPPTKRWRYDYDTAESFWSWQRLTSPLLAPLLTAGGQPPTKQWRYDYDAESAWQFAPLFNQVLGAAPAVNPFKHAQWSFTYSDDAAWQHLGSRNASLFTAAPFALRAWRFGLDEPSGWIWSPRSSALLAPILTVGGQPPTKCWRYDYDTGEAFWQFAFPINFGSFTFVARAQPFFNVWSYEYNYDIAESSWAWQAPASPPLYIVPAPSPPPPPPPPAPTPSRAATLGRPPLIIGETINDPLNPQHSIKVNPDGSINITAVTSGAPRPSGGQPAVILGETVNDKDNPEYSIKVNPDGSINVKKV